MDKHRDEPGTVEEAPGLTVALYYLRPFRREKLLAALAGLGLFVHEQRHGMPHAPASPTDLAIAVAGEQHCGLIQSMSGVAPVLVAIVDSPSAIRPCTLAGADFAILDSDIIESPRESLLAAAGLARQLRESGHAVPPGVRGPFDVGGAAFHSESCVLVYGSDRVPLSRAERDVLSRLAAERGKPVPSDVLARAAHLRVFPTSRYLTSVIVNLRRKLRRLGVDPGALATVHGVGYVLLSQDQVERGGP